MSFYDKADFVGAHAIDAAYKRDFILKYANNRGHLLVTVQVW